MITLMTVPLSVPVTATVLKRKQMIAYWLYVRYSLSNGLDLYYNASAKGGNRRATDSQSHPLRDPRSQGMHPI